MFHAERISSPELEARLHAYRNEREAFERALLRVLEAEGENPYYRWVAGIR
jgi:hypothetical protein